jgi:3-methyladenine DNA glycosylase Tag
MAEKLEQVQVDDRISRFIREERDNKYQDYDDDAVFQALVQIVFEGGVSSTVWERHGKATLQLFQSVKRTAGLKDIDSVLKNRRILRNKRKVESVIYNARAMMELAKLFGSFRAYVDFFFGDNECLVRNLTMRFKGMQETNARGLLKYIGVDVLKDDSNIRKVLGRLGLISAEDCEYSEVLGVCEGISKAAKERITVVDSVLWAYGALSDYTERAICHTQWPLCWECPLAWEHCSQGMRNIGRTFGATSA